MKKILKCGAYVVDITDKVVEINPRALGCSSVGNGDVFDLGFRDKDLIEHGLTCIHDGKVIFTIKEDRNPTVKELILYLRWVAKASGEPAVLIVSKTGSIVMGGGTTGYSVTLPEFLETIRKYNDAHPHAAVEPPWQDGQGSTP